MSRDNLIQSIFNFIYTIYLKLLSFFIIQTDERKFIEVNTPHWIDIQEKNENEFVLIEGINTLNSRTSYIPLNGRVAKAIQEEKGCTPIVLMPYFSFLSKPEIALYKSYNIENFIFLQNSFFNISAILKAFIYTFRFLKTNPKPIDLLNIKCKNIIIGDLIYDTIVRYEKNTFTVKEINLKCLKYVFVGFFQFIIYEKYYEKFNIKYVYLSHVVYSHFGILARLGHSQGAKIIMASNHFAKIYNSQDDIRAGHILPDPQLIQKARIQKENTIQDVDVYLSQRFSGEIPTLLVEKAYKNKVNYTKESLKNTLGINNDNIIVFIVPHAFSDAIHYTPYEKHLFIDYYEWFNETIKEVSKIQDVNWIVKPLPVSFIYNEEGVVEQILKEINSSNIYLAPPDLSTYSIKAIASVILTVQGTVGLEFSCVGIPTVISAKAVYSGHGFTIEPKNKDEYFQKLHNIKDIMELNVDQMMEAKILLWCIHTYPSSNFNDPLYSNNWKNLINYMKQYSRKNDDFYIAIKSLI